MPLAKTIQACRLFLAVAITTGGGIATAREAITEKTTAADLVWPVTGKPYDPTVDWKTWAQPTVSGRPESGLFGCVRTGGAQFHEGIDITATQRDRQGEPTDPVYAAMSGRVAYVNAVAGKSSYGRYIVIEHEDATPAVFTLYAHLRAIAPGIKAGKSVTTGEVIATLGRSAGGYAIPKSRAHLHFEIGLRLTDDFSSWYRWKKLPGKNEHGNFNGQNLVGLDPSDYFAAHAVGRSNGPGDYIATLAPACVLRVGTRQIPDFVQRYPSLVVGPMPPDGDLIGWDVAFSGFGLPISWTPLTVTTAPYLSRVGEVKLVFTDKNLLKAYSCRHTVGFDRSGEPRLEKSARQFIELLFAFR